MHRDKCPGQDAGRWTPKDIFEVPCTHCQGLIEFFKDDLRRHCPSCGKLNLNPHNDLACAAWCSSARECRGELANEIREAKPARDQSK